MIVFVLKPIDRWRCPSVQLYHVTEGQRHRSILKEMHSLASAFNPRRFGGSNFNPSEICSTQCVQLQFDGMIARGDHLHHEDISGRNVVITKAKFKKQIQITNSNPNSNPNPNHLHHKDISGRNVVITKA